MRVHRTEHVRHFTVLPNGLLQDRRLSYTARGLLTDLLSRPDGWREDGRHMADSSPQGRGAILGISVHVRRTGVGRGRMGGGLDAGEGRADQVLLPEPLPAPWAEPTTRRPALGCG
ncbi:hypothetical protein [Kitasatospora sp. GP82]|uniref:hypothetical protein n=1 Tax=Kitasatospora sp. GP82 TaxID=3035089 RepID=UPI002473650C|nr:hypothetical protein [Kitasatospora sp. GP82]MDH6127955.1 hypothetical protein [Kitasatospora sp. GP82]